MAFRCNCPTCSNNENRRSRQKCWDDQKKQFAQSLQRLVMLNNEEQLLPNPHPVNNAHLRNNCTKFCECLENLLTAGALQYKEQEYSVLEDQIELKQENLQNNDCNACYCLQTDGRKYPTQLPNIYRLSNVANSSTVSVSTRTVKSGVGRNPAKAKLTSDLRKRGGNSMFVNESDLLNLRSRPKAFEPKVGSTETRSCSGRDNWNGDRRRCMKCQFDLSKNKGQKIQNRAKSSTSKNIKSTVRCKYIETDLDPFLRNLDKNLKNENTICISELNDKHKIFVNYNSKVDVQDQLDEVRNSFDFRPRRKITNHSNLGAECSKDDISYEIVAENLEECSNYDGHYAKKLRQRTQSNIPILNPITVVIVTGQQEKQHVMQNESTSISTIRLNIPSTMENCDKLTDNPESTDEDMPRQPRLEESNKFYINDPVLEMQKKAESIKVVKSSEILKPIGNNNESTEYGEKINDDLSNQQTLEERNNCQIYKCVINSATGSMCQLALNEIPKLKKSYDKSTSYREDLYEHLLKHLTLKRSSQLKVSDVENTCEILPKQQILKGINMNEIYSRVTQNNGISLGQPTLCEIPNLICEGLGTDNRECIYEQLLKQKTLNGSQFEIFNIKNSHEDSPRQQTFKGGDIYQVSSCVMHNVGTSISELRFNDIPNTLKDDGYLINREDKTYEELYRLHKQSSKFQIYNTVKELSLKPTASNQSAKSDDIGGNSATVKSCCGSSDAINKAVIPYCPTGSYHQMYTQYNALDNCQTTEGNEATQALMTDCLQHYCESGSKRETIATNEYGCDELTDTTLDTTNQSGNTLAPSEIKIDVKQSLSKSETNLYKIQRVHSLVTLVANGYCSGVTDSETIASEPMQMCYHSSSVAKKSDRNAVSTRKIRSSFPRIKYQVKSKTKRSCESNAVHENAKMTGESILTIDTDALLKSQKPDKQQCGIISEEYMPCPIRTTENLDIKYRGDCNEKQINVALHEMAWSPYDANGRILVQKTNLSAESKCAKDLSKSANDYDSTAEAAHANVSNTLKEADDSQQIIEKSDNILQEISKDKPLEIIKESTDKDKHANHRKNSMDFHTNAIDNEPRVIYRSDRYGGSKATVKSLSGNSKAKDDPNLSQRSRYCILCGKPKLKINMKESCQCDRILKGKVETVVAKIEKKTRDSVEIALNRRKYEAQQHSNETVSANSYDHSHSQNKMYKNRGVVYDSVYDGIKILRNIKPQRSKCNSKKKNVRHRRKMEQQQDIDIKSSAMLRSANAKQHRTVSSKRKGVFNFLKNYFHRRPCIIAQPRNTNSSLTPNTHISRAKGGQDEQSLDSYNALVLIYKRENLLRTNTGTSKFPSKTISSGNINTHQQTLSSADLREPSSDLLIHRHALMKSKDNAVMHSSYSGDLSMLRAKYARNPKEADCCGKASIRNKIIDSIFQKRPASASSIFGSQPSMERPMAGEQRSLNIYREGGFYNSNNVRYSGGGVGTEGDATQESFRALPVRDYRSSQHYSTQFKKPNRNSAEYNKHKDDQPKSAALEYFNSMEDNDRKTSKKLIANEQATKRKLRASPDQQANNASLDYYLNATKQDKLDKINKKPKKLRNTEAASTSVTKQKLHLSADMNDASLKYYLDSLEKERRIKQLKRMQREKVPWYKRLFMGNPKINIADTMSNRLNHTENDVRSETLVSNTSNQTFDKYPGREKEELIKDSYHNQARKQITAYSSWGYDAVSQKFHQGPRVREKNNKMKNDDFKLQSVDSANFIKRHNSRRNDASVRSYTDTPAIAQHLQAKNVDVDQSSKLMGHIRSQKESSTNRAQTLPSRHSSLGKRKKNADSAGPSGNEAMNTDFETENIDLIKELLAKKTCQDLFAALHVTDTKEETHKPRNKNLAENEKYTDAEKTASIMKKHSTNNDGHNQLMDKSGGGASKMAAIYDIMNNSQHRRMKSTTPMDLAGLLNFPREDALHNMFPTQRCNVGVITVINPKIASNHVEIGKTKSHNNSYLFAHKKSNNISSASKSSTFSSNSNRRMQAGYTSTNSRPRARTQESRSNKRTLGSILGYPNYQSD